MYILLFFFSSAGLLKKKWRKCSTMLPWTDKETCSTRTSVKLSKVARRKKKKRSKGSQTRTVLVYFFPYNFLNNGLCACSSQQTS